MIKQKQKDQSDIGLLISSNRSADKLNKLIKYYPPFKNDEIPDETINFYDEKGEMGWRYLTSHILNNSSAIHNKIEKINLEK